MYRLFTIITITQQPTADYPNRNSRIGLDFVNTFESSDTWRDLTNKGRIVVPKNLYYKDENGKQQPLNGTNVCIGGFGLMPLFMRGDRVTIEAGYKYINEQNREVLDTAQMFRGFISKVHSKIPIELELEDNMWKLKQTPVETHTFSATDTLEDIMKFILKGTGFTTKALTKTTFGEFQIGNETAAQVLYRLQKEKGFEFYFRQDQLRGGVLIYIEEEAETQYFRFQQNIISDELEYRRKDDIVLSAIAHNTITEETGKVTKDGVRKTRKKRISVLVTIQNGRRVDKEIKSGETVPENESGERREFYFPGATTVKELADLAYEKIKLYYYTGLKGSFTTFGIPFVRQGDNVDIKDPVLPERDGVYKVKAVNYSGGINGLRQEIHLDYKLN